MSKVKRTSISIDQQTLAKGLKRVRELGYDSFSEYLSFLVERDHHENPEHVTVRAAGRPVESHYSTSATDPPLQPSRQPAGKPNRRSA